MRNFFLALVLANLGFAAWSAWFAAPQRSGRPADDGLPALTLVSEVPADLRPSGAPLRGVVVEPADASESATASESASAERPTTAAATDTAAPSRAAPGAEPPPSEQPLATAADRSTTAAARCASVGPFRELSQVATAAAALRAEGYQPQQRVAEGEIWIGYWVYIGGIATEAAANEILAKVRDGGIADSQVIPNSDSGNLVSLGVFSEISGVSRRREQVRALGFEPQVVDRTRRATVYWIDVSLGPDQTLDYDALQTPGRISRLEQRDCEQSPG
ncbi:MAG TPA: SPOR domain-containing protein [Gammaproteobacteria bacterium]|nr:SPOR domain-containing protein [Gammaproteobacteria bacterium]